MSADSSPGMFHAGLSLLPLPLPLQQPAACQCSVLLCAAGN